MADFSERFNRFAWRLFQTVQRNNANENIFFSPTSVQLALSMTMVGARNETAKELEFGLQFEGTKDVHSQVGSLASKLYADNPGMKLTLANRMFVEQSSQLESDFVNTLQKHYKSTVGSVNFKGQFEAARVAINKWVEQQTNNKIKDLLQPNSVNTDTRVVLVNAIHFKCMWEHPFPSYRSYDAKFFTTPEKQRDVRMMGQKTQFNFSASEELGYQMVELPFKENAFSMLILLPLEKHQLDKVLAKVSVDQIMLSARNSEPMEVELTMPKFQLEATLNLEEPQFLPAMGIKKLFNRNEVDLSGVTKQDKLVVSKVVHKAFLDVNEEGAEAAAATAVGMECMMMNPNLIFFHVDEPFLLAIRENNSNTILFLGKITEP